MIVTLTVTCLLRDTVLGFSFELEELVCFLNYSWRCSAGSVSLCSAHREEHVSERSDLVCLPFLDLGNDLRASVAVNGRGRRKLRRASSVSG